MGLASRSSLYLVFATRTEAFGLAPVPWIQWFRGGGGWKMERLPYVAVLKPARKTQKCIVVNLPLKIPEINRI